MAALYAVTDEVHQTFVSGRSAAVGDVLLDCGAALAAILAITEIWRMVRARKPVEV